jgi:glycosyltransferase involved in cell wall biosynthesis
MFFTFNKYIAPAFYFNLQPEFHNPYCVDYTKLSSTEQALIDFDINYKTLESSKIDAAYQAFQKGLIKDNSFSIVQQIEVTNVNDNYRFVKKYFHPFWVYYILLIRILTFKNPITEFKGFFNTLNISKIDLFDKINNHSNFISFNSSLLDEKPFISIVIPTLNRYNYLKDVLRDLENQTYKNFEVLIFDQSAPFQSSFYNGWNLNLKLVQQEEKALWLARNRAIQNSKGEYVLLYDDDSLVENDWIENHIKCLDFFNAEISSGVSIVVVGSKVPKHYSFFRWSDQLDTGNVMIKKDVFRKLGLFDRQFEKQRQGDGEFGLRAYLAGFKNISNPLSRRVHLKVKDGGLREMGSWDAYRPKKIFAPRPIPSVLYLIRKYFGRDAALLNILFNTIPSLVPYRFKRNRFIHLIGIILTTSFLPFVIFTVVKSWRISTNMLKEGSKIEKLI